MKLCPTSGPIITSNSQKAREARSSRHSCASSQPKLCESQLREGKKHLLQAPIGQPGRSPQLVERSFAYHAAAAQQHQAVADARRVVQLVDGKKQRAALRRGVAQQRHYIARLPEIQAVERFVEQQQRMRRQQS